ncbi:MULTISPECIES: hypothetical protein [Pseudomonas]|uniref:hypothetical protein n=1 Tax=Pseudomonas TaxID=286 RepID=UPI000C08CA05|nr:MULTISPECIES: hypothetical protein [Pseudomonas]MCD5986511.1 hypothetical protein [Pseudomonas quasicaspiana]PHN28831.1 hypothetical protein AO242_25390 [Pseudomonas sp. ICMP 561]
MNKFFLMSCAALLAGCVGHYPQPALTAPHATLDAKWGNNNLMSGGFQAYWAYHDGHCQDTKNTGVLGRVSQSESEKNQFLVEPDRRIYLNALSSGTKQREATDPSLIQRSCMNISSFIPEAGATYQITHSAPKSGCYLEVVDIKTGKAPASLVIEPVTKECGL